MSGRSSAEATLTAPPLEREEELHRIREVLSRAAAGGGELLLVEGPSGIGKSRLLAEASTLAVEDGMEVLQARASDLEREHAWGVAISIFEPRIRHANGGADSQLLRGRAALAAPLLSRDAAEPSKATSEFELFHGLYWALVNLTEESPIAIVVDDAHWADATSLRFLIYLAQRIEDLPIALIVAIRTGDPEAESDLVARLSGLTPEGRLRPAELSLDATTTLLAAAGVDTTHTGAMYARASWEVTRGNPFLLQELCAVVRQDLQSGGKTDPSRLKNFAPESVARSVVMRLKGLGEDCLRFARAASTLGDGKPLQRVADVAGMEIARALSAWQRLVGAQFFTDQEQPTFAHPMIRSAVQAEFPADERRLQHAQAAELLHKDGAPADEIAPHLLIAMPVTEPWALDALHAAARHAARRGAPESAARFLRRALDLCAPADRTPAVLIDLGLAEAACGEMTSLSRLEEALAMIDDPEEEARALYALGHTLQRYGRHLDAADVFARGRDRFEHRDPMLALKFEGSLIGAAFYCAGNPGASIRAVAMRRLKAVAESLGDREPASGSERIILAVAAVEDHLVHPGSPAKALDLARAALTSAGERPDEAADNMAVAIAVLALVSSGHPDEAEHAADELLVHARERGDVLAFAEASALRAFALHARGRIGDAMADAQAAVENTQRGWGTIVPIPDAVLAHCLIERGELDAAEKVIERVGSTIEANSSLDAFLFWARGRLRYERADPGGALDDFRVCERLFSSEGMSTSPAACPWRAPAALAANAAGDHDEAVRLIEEEIRLAKMYDLPGYVGAALHVRAHIDGLGTAESTLQEAIQHLESADMPLELARALVSLGGVLRRGGRRVESRDPLRRGLDIAHRCGANALAQRAWEELVASGARPRRAMTSGANSLTPSERRVAELVARGYTNRQIAETLFVTKATVEWHLRHVYPKLNVSSREEVKEKLEAHDLVEGAGPFDPPAP